MLDTEKVGSPGEPYATLFRIVERQPATDAELEDSGLKSLALSLRPDGELLEKIVELSGATFRPPLIRCLAAAAPARSVIVEHGYYDLDFRSEYSLAHATRYGATTPPHSIRLHFFKSSLTFDLVFSSKAESLQRSYLGYAVLRPFGRGVVGRTLIAPPSKLTGVVGCLFSDRVRTVVTEDVQLLGHTLRASGVPFLEQDGHMLRCAHTVAWQTHYSAVLHGLVPRRPTAAFFTAGLASPIAGTRYPSVGLTAPSIVDVLTKFDLSPEIIDLRELRSALEIELHHRTSVGSQDEHEWWRSNVTAAVCRYLNSGTPVGLAIADHAITICGYIRRRNVGSRMPVCIYGSQRTQHRLWRDCCRQSYDDDDVVAFVVHDDQVGPYVLVAVEHILELAQVDSSIMIIPRPHGQWLPGSDAEKVGWRFFRSSLQEVARSPETYFDDASEEILELFRDDLESLTTMLNDRQLAVRSYVLPSADFKVSYLERCYCRQARELVSLVRLPKHVWVVEIFIRSRRIDGSGVIAQVVLDASGPTEREARVILLQLPNLLIAEEPEWDGKQLKRICTIGVMETGRWAHKRAQATMASRAKAAIPEESLQTLF